MCGELARFFYQSNGEELTAPIPDGTSKAMRSAAGGDRNQPVVAFFVFGDEVGG